PGGLATRPQVDNLPHTAAMNSAMAAIQNARNGMSASNELPFTTNAGTAKNSSVAHNGLNEKRRARDHIASATTTENKMYAAWNGASRISPISASSSPRNQALKGGCGCPRISTLSP